METKVSMESNKTRMARIAAECSKFAGDIDTSVQYLELAYCVRG